MSKSGGLELGFADFADDLKAILEKVTDEKVHAKALEAGAEPVVNHAKLLAPRGKSGHLIQSIGAEYSDKTNTVRIGIGEPVSTRNSSTGYYGRFQNDGWHPAGGRRRMDGRLDKRTKRTAGKVRGKNFINTAMNAQEGNAFKIILDELTKALEGVGKS